MTTGDGTGLDRVDVWVNAWLSRLDEDLQRISGPKEKQDERVEELKTVKTEIAARTLYDRIRERGEKYFEAGFDRFHVSFYRPSVWHRPYDYDGQMRVLSARVEGQQIRRYFVDEVSEPIGDPIDVKVERRKMGVMDVDKLSYWYCEDCSVTTHSYIEHPSGPCPMRKDERGQTG